MTAELSVMLLLYWDTGGRWRSSPQLQPPLGLHVMTHTEGRALMDAHTRTDYANDAGVEV